MIYDMICYDMIWYDIWYMIWYMIYDIWYDIWYDMIWYDMIYLTAVDSHQVAVVQYTYTHKQYRERNKTNNT
jgi:hypothetical protein